MILKIPIEKSYFCDDGQIVQKGTHAELSKEKDGKYFALWNAQAKYYQREEL